MRKLITLGVWALLLTMMNSPVVAGNVDECEVLLDASPGLYGLCIAYHNAGNSNAMDKILANYNKKRGPDDPPMPGLDGVPCPCFNSDDLSNVGLAFACAISSSGTGLDLAMYGGGLIQFGTDDLGCFSSNFFTSEFIELNTTAEENKACRDIILEAIDRDFSGLICQEGDS